MIKFQQVLQEREEEIQSRVRQSEPLREKLTEVEKSIVRMEKHKDHFHAKLKANLKALEDSKTALAKIKTKEEPQVAKAKKWSEAEVETTKKPDAIHRESKNFASSKQTGQLISLFPSLDKI